MDCVFCRIRDGQIPSTRVYEDERTIAFMDINPLNEGHTLVISRAHAATLYEADEVDLQAAIVDLDPKKGEVKRYLLING